MQGIPRRQESDTPIALPEGELWNVAAELPFEPHRIRLDETGRYDEALNREFPFVVRLFHFRHKDYTPGLTWHERLEILLPLDALTKMRMGEQEVELQPGEILIVDNLRLHMTVDYPGFESRVIVVSFLPEFVYSLGSPSYDYYSLLPFFLRSKPDRRAWCQEVRCSIRPWWQRSRIFWNAISRAGSISRSDAKLTCSDCCMP